MKITLTESMFTNNRYEVSYSSNKKATFILIDEEFSGDGKLGIVKKIICITGKVEADGTLADKSVRGLVIGLGDEYVGASSEIRSLLGKTMNKDNMSSCVVELYEDGD